MVEAKLEVKVKKVSIALKLLPVFTGRKRRKKSDSCSNVAIALRLLPVFTLERAAMIPRKIELMVSIALKLLPVFTHFFYCFHRNSNIKSFNRPQALTCFHTAAVFNAENLCLFKPQNTNLSFSPHLSRAVKPACLYFSISLSVLTTNTNLPHSEACLKILLHF